MPPHRPLHAKSHLTVYRNMPHIRANGHTSHTQHPAPVVTEGICRYLAGQPGKAAAEEAGMPAATLLHTLRRHDLIRSKSEAWIQKWVDRGKASMVARRRLIEREYSKNEAWDQLDELANQFAVCEKTIRRDLRSIGYDLSRSEVAIVREWGSFQGWRKAQRRAAVLVRKRDWTKKRACEEMNITFRTLQRLLSAWDKRKEGGEQPLHSRSTYVTA